MLTDMPDSLPGVETQYWFPDHSELQFPAGEMVLPSSHQCLAMLRMCLLCIMSAGMATQVATPRHAPRLMPRVSYLKRLPQG